MNVVTLLVSFAIGIVSGLLGSAIVIALTRR